MLMQQKYSMVNRIKNMSKYPLLQNENYRFIHKGSILKTVGTRQLYYYVIDVDYDSHEIVVVSLMTYVLGRITFKMSTFMSIVEPTTCFYNIPNDYKLNFGDIVYNRGSGEVLATIKYFEKSGEKFIAFYPMQYFTYDQFFNKNNKIHWRFQYSINKARVLHIRFIENYIRKFDLVSTISPENHDMSLGFPPFREDTVDKSGALQMWQEYQENEWTDEKLREVIVEYDLNEFNKKEIQDTFAFLDDEVIQELSRRSELEKERRRVAAEMEEKKKEEEAERKRKEKKKREEEKRREKEEREKRRKEAAEKHRKLVEWQEKETRIVWLKENWAINRLNCVTVWQSNPSHRDKGCDPIDVVFHNRVSEEIVNKAVNAINRYIDVFIDKYHGIEVEDIVLAMYHDNLQNYIASIKKRYNFVIDVNGEDVIAKEATASECVGVFSYSIHGYDYYIFPNNHESIINEIIPRIELIQSYSLDEYMVWSRGLKLINQYPGMDIVIAD